MRFTIVSVAGALLCILQGCVPAGGARGHVDKALDVPNSGVKGHCTYRDSGGKDYPPGREPEGRPCPGVRIAILTAGGEKIAVMISDSDGRFGARLPPGSYKIAIVEDDNSFHVRESFTVRPNQFVEKVLRFRGEIAQ